MRFKPCLLSCAEKEGVDTNVRRSSAARRTLKKMESFVLEEVKLSKYTRPYIK